MFKSIEYKLYFYLFLLIGAVVICTVLAWQKEYVYMLCSFFLVLYSIYQLRRHYNQFNKNILFLLNALETGDFTFHFRETKLSGRERELNRMMNRIKDILAKARKEIIENEKFQAVILESVSTGIIIMDENNQIVEINSAVNKLLGLPVFTHINQLAPLDKSLPDMIRNLNDTDTKSLKIANEREEVQLSLRSSTVLVRGVKLKIISLSNIRSEMDHMELDSWIRLIRVMTHEIMNSIAPVTSLTDTLLSAYWQQYTIASPEAGESVQADDAAESQAGLESAAEERVDPLIENTIEALQTINTTAKGLVNFVNSYRKFTGIPKPQMAPVSLQQLIEQTITLEAATLEEWNVTVTLQLPPQPMMVTLDESQIKQVLLNLLKNAVEATAGEGGEIRIALTREREKLHLDLCNNGRPIPEEVLPNIFVPFFTTKESGTGIGLSLSRYIMRLHGGTLTHFTDGDWTVFRLTFV